jgi:hypothetical protein
VQLILHINNEPTVVCAKIIEYRASGAISRLYVAKCIFRKLAKD